MKMVYIHVSISCISEAFVLMSLMSRLYELLAESLSRNNDTRTESRIL